jgi:hypothetical protein
MTTEEDKRDDPTLVGVASAGIAFMLGMSYAPTGWIWGLLGLVVFPWVVWQIAAFLLARMTWTPLRVFQAKRRAAAVFIAFCVWQAFESAHQTSHVECAQETGGRDSDCVEWKRVRGGDAEVALMFMVLGGIVLWQTAQSKEPGAMPIQPQDSDDDGE